MHVSGETKPNSSTATTILPICARLRDLNAGKSAHAYVIKSGYETDTLVGNALVSFYAKCGLVSNDAFAVFSSIIHKDVVSWNSILVGYVHEGLVDEAVRIFNRMPLEMRNVISWNLVIGGRCLISLSVHARQQPERRTYFTMSALVNLMLIARIALR